MFVQLCSDDGRMFVDFNLLVGMLKFVVLMSIEFIVLIVMVNVLMLLIVNLLQLGFSGVVIVQGLFLFFGGMIGSVVSGVVVVIIGMINFVGMLIVNGKCIDDLYMYNGVQFGLGNSGNVN